MINVSFKKSAFINKCFLCNRARNVLRIAFMNVIGDEVRTLDLCDACKAEIAETFSKVSHVNVPMDNA